MIRPIETNMSLFTLEQKAHQAKSDPNAHTNLAMQQAAAIKKNEDQLKIVQKSPESEGDVKISDKDSEKNRGDHRKRRRRGNDGEAEDDTEARAKDAGGGSFDFLA